MSSTASQILRLELIGTGDQAGTWGNTTNTNLGTLLEGAIAGLASVSVTSANQALAATDYAADQARMAILTLTTTTLAAFNVYAPPVSKTYVVYNNSAYDATIFNSTVLGNTTAAGLGVTIPAGRIVSVWSNGTDFYIAAVAGPASSTDNAVVRYDGTTGKVVQNSGVTIDDSNNITGIVDETLSGNLNFTGTAKRITGDFSNATVASRVMFQTSTVNGNIGIFAIPNGTATTAVWAAINNSDPTNASFGSFGTDGTTSVRILSGLTGSGSYLPMTFFTGGSERVRVDTSGNVGIGTSSPSGASGTVLEVNGGAGQARFVLKNNTTGSASTDGSQIALVGSQLVIQNREASEIVFETNGAEQVRIDSVGNVGIGGITTPLSRLDVLTAGGSCLGTFRNGTTTAQVGVTSSGGGQAYFGSTTNHLTRLIQNGTTQLQISTTGLVQMDNGYGSLETFYGCRAWINFNGTTVTNPASMTGVRGSGNVSSVLDNGTGDYTINFTNAMPDGNYAFTGAAESNIVGDARIVTARNGGISSSSCRITVRSDTNVAEDCPTVTFVVHR